MALAAVSVASIVCTYVTLTTLQSRREEKARVKAFEESQARRKKQNETQAAKGDPDGKLLASIHLNNVYLWEVEHLGRRFKAEGDGTNVMHFSPSAPKNLFHLGQSTSTMSDQSAVELDTEYNKLIGDEDCIIADLVRKPNMPDFTKAYLRAGPRKHLHFKPQSVNAAIVTCGGLCPGLNNVVREVVNTLISLYGIGGTVYGILGGYKGFYDKDLPPIVLTRELVNDIHHEGGTVLGSSRGGFDINKILKFLREKRIQQLYVIGGDGTHRGAFKIHEACIEHVSTSTGAMMRSYRM